MTDFEHKLDKPVIVTFFKDEFRGDKDGWESLHQQLGLEHDPDTTTLQMDLTVTNFKWILG